MCSHGASGEPRQQTGGTLDRGTASAIFRSEILAPLVGVDNTVDVKELLQTLKAAMKRGQPTMTVAIICLTSPKIVPAERLATDAVVDLFHEGFSEYSDSAGLVSVAAAGSSSAFKNWCVAAGFDANSAQVDDTPQQRVEIFKDFGELSRLCELGGDQSAICLLRGVWLQEQLAAARRTDVPFVLPSRNGLPPGAAYTGPITADRVFIIALSYCWAGPGQPDPENKLLSDVCELLAYFHVSRYFGHHDSVTKELIIGAREILVFWDWSCLYQKSDGGVTLLQLDSFGRGLSSINVLYAHVDTVSLLCTNNYPVVERPHYGDSAWPYFEQLISMLIKPANLAVNLPAALAWIRTKSGELTSSARSEQANCGVFWLFRHVRRAKRQLPVVPKSFDVEIERKTATNGSDIAFLKKKYRHTFRAVMEPAEVLELGDVPGPTGPQWHSFLTVTLRECPHLRQVNLSANEAITAATLDVFTHLTALQVLKVSVCVGFVGTLGALRSLGALRELHLQGCVALEGTVEPLSSLQKLQKVDLEACFGLVGGLESLSSLPELESLNVCDTQLDTLAFVEGRRRRWQAGALKVDGCQVGRYGDEVTPLFRAANFGQVETARRLLAERVGAVVEVDRAEKRTGATPLIQAATQGFLEVARVLLQHRADPNKANFNGFTPLLKAAQEGFVKVARLLLQHRADINKVENNKRTPLNHAAFNGHAAVVHFLLDQGADTTLQNAWGCDPLTTAQTKGYDQVVALLMWSVRRGEIDSDSVRRQCLDGLCGDE